MHGLEENEILGKYEELITSYIGIINVDTNETNPKAAMPDGATLIEGDANKGIVIRDSNGNEWTWVEVPKTIFKENVKGETDYDNIKDALITYAADYRNSSSIDEWYALDGDTRVTARTEGLTDEQKELNNGCGLTYNEYEATYKKMLSSIYANGGFWISRYEIGDSIKTKNNTTITNNIDTTIKVVSQANMIPYSEITCSKAQNLASGMSTDSQKTSNLLFGIQWDLVCKFLEVKGNWDITTNSAIYYIKNNSKSWGNHSNSSLKLNRGMYKKSNWNAAEWIEYTKDTENYVINKQTSNLNYNVILTTGASEDTNKMNIYDFAGNLNEWTLETRTNASKNWTCTCRGGCFNHLTSYISAGGSYSDGINFNATDTGFRTALY